MGLTQSKPISTDPKIINKPVWHVWTVKTSFLQVYSFQTSVKAGHARITMCSQMVNSEIREYFHLRFVQIRKAREIIRIWTKRKWNYSLISRVYHLITY